MGCKEFNNRARKIIFRSERQWNKQALKKKIPLRKKEMLETRIYNEGSWEKSSRETQTKAQ